MKASKKLDLVIDAMPDCWVKSNSMLFVSPSIYRSFCKEKNKKRPRKYRGVKLIIEGQMPKGRIDGRYL